tara:strand:- start:478 stop:801 length:324 start_codon:yes stop_codon:yes gene_type:complete
MLLKEQKNLLKQIKEINILTKPKKSTFIGKTQKLLIPEQIFNLKNNTIIISGHITIEREYNQKCNFEYQNKTTKIFFGIYDKNNSRNFITFKEHLEIQKVLEKKIQL